MTIEGLPLSRSKSWPYLIETLAANRNCSGLSIIPLCDFCQIQPKLKLQKFHRCHHSSVIRKVPRIGRRVYFNSTRLTELFQLIKIFFNGVTKASGILCKFYDPQWFKNETKGSSRSDFRFWWQKLCTSQSFFVESLSTNTITGCSLIPSCRISLAT